MLCVCNFHSSFYFLTCIKPQTHTLLDAGGGDQQINIFLLHLFATIHYHLHHTTLSWKHLIDMKY